MRCDGEHVSFAGMIQLKQQSNRNHDLPERNVPRLRGADLLSRDWWSDNNTYRVSSSPLINASIPAHVTSARASLWSRRCKAAFSPRRPRRRRGSRQHSPPGLTRSDWCVIELAALFDCPSKLKAEGSLSLQLKPAPRGPRAQGHQASGVPATLVGWGII